MQFGDLLQRMGWKNISPVIRYGHGGNAGEFRAKMEKSADKAPGDADSREKRIPSKAADRPTTDSPESTGPPVVPSVLIAWAVRSIHDSRSRPNGC